MVNLCRSCIWRPTSEEEAKEDLPYSKAFFNEVLFVVQQVCKTFLHAGDCENVSALQHRRFKYSWLSRIECLDIKSFLLSAFTRTVSLLAEAFDGLGGQYECKNVRVLDLFSVSTRCSSETFNLCSTAAIHISRHVCHSSGGSWLWTDGGGNGQIGGTTCAAIMKPSVWQLSLWTRLRSSNDIMKQKDQLSTKTKHCGMAWLWRFEAMTPNLRQNLPTWNLDSFAEIYLSKDEEV